MPTIIIRQFAVNGLYLFLANLILQIEKINARRRI